VKSGKAHIITQIRPGDRHDRLLRAFFGGSDWQSTSPTSCRREWIGGPQLLAIARSMSLATDIWACRQHLEERWPGWTIYNDQWREGGECHTRYRLMLFGEVNEFEREKQARRIGQRGAEAVKPGGGQGVSVLATGHKAPSAPAPACTGVQKEMFG